MAEDRFIRVSNGAVYRYSPALMKRADAMVISGLAAADHYRKMGVENDITAKYPESELTRGVPEPPAKKTTRRVPKKTRSDKTPTTVVSTEEEPDALKELLGDAENILAGDSAGQTNPPG